jgi:hypothetical protein
MNVFSLGLCLVTFFTALYFKLRNTATSDELPQINEPKPSDMERQPLLKQRF